MRSHYWYICYWTHYCTRHHSQINYKSRWFIYKSYFKLNILAMILTHFIWPDLVGSIYFCNWNILYPDISKAHAYAGAVQSWTELQVISGTVPGYIFLLKVWTFKWLLIYLSFTCVVFLLVNVNCAYKNYESLQEISCLTACNQLSV